MAQHETRKRCRSYLPRPGQLDRRFRLLGRGGGDDVFIERIFADRSRRIRAGGRQIEGPRHSIVGSILAGIQVFLKNRARIRRGGGFVVEGTLDRERRFRKAQRAHETPTLPIDGRFGTGDAEFAEQRAGRIGGIFHRIGRCRHIARHDDIEAPRLKARGVLLARVDDAGIGSRRT